MWMVVQCSERAAGDKSLLVREEPKKEPEDYVRFRHSLSSNLQFDGAVVHRVDTDRPLEDVVQQVKGAIQGAWAAEMP
jgi:hypothetical protein